MKELDDYTCRTRLVLTKQLLWRTAMVITAVFLLNPAAFAQDKAPDLPSADRCVAQDLLATKARLIGDSPCYTCEEGNEILSTLELTIYNKTGSVRTSVAFWATLEITDPAGKVTESYITGCTGPLSGSEYESFGFDQIEYRCGDALKLKNIYLAWTDASDGDRNQCPLDPSIIAPKCRAQGDLVIIPPLSARVEAFEKPCVGESNGSINVFAQGGTGNGYTYTLNPGNITSSTGEFTDLGEGAYTIKIEDSEKCSTVVEFVLEDQVCCVPPTITAQPDDESVCEGETASFTVAYTGGDPAPTIQWQISTDGTNWINIEDGSVYSGATTATLSISATTEAMNGNLYRAEFISGTCDAVYSDPADLVVNEIPDAPSVSVIHPTCAAVGSITVTAPTGTNFKYSIDGEEWQDGVEFADLATGTYTVWVRNEVNCVTESEETVINPVQVAPAAPEVAVLQPTCINASGRITITSPTTNLMFSLNGGTYEAYPTGGWVVAESGEYTIVARNDALCVSADTKITVNQQPFIPDAPVSGGDQIACEADEMPLLTATATAPEGIRITWYTAAERGDLVLSPTLNTVGTVTYYAEANYGKLGPDAGCISSTRTAVTLTIIERSAEPTATVVQPTCISGGSITVTSPTGAGMAYSINAGVTWQNELTFADLNAGIYTVFVRNELGCITEGDKITINSVPDAPTVNAGTDKVLTCTTTSVTLNRSSTTAGATYAWVASNGGNIVSGANTASPTVNAAGTYTLTINTIRSGCTSTDVVVVTRDASTPNVSAKGGTLSCANGSLQLMGYSTTAGVSYNWTGPNGYTSSMQHPTVTVAGSYTLTVTNSSNGCTASTTVMVNPQPKGSDPIVTCHTLGFGYDHYSKGLITTINTPEGPVAVTGKKRNPDGTYAAQNHAALFDTQAPTGDDTDLYTTDWDLALIINQDQTNVPNDNQWGGEMTLDFSAIGPVTMESLRALDIDNYEDMSWVYLYDGQGNELYKVRLQNLGDNSKQMVNLGNTKGVMMMKIVLDGRNESGHLAGSGAIDDIRFCVEEPGTPCVDEQETTEAVSISNVSAYPTPFIERATIEFRVYNSENYVVNLYDTKGKLIKQLKTGTAVAGEMNTVEVDGRNLAEGMYLARIASESGAKTVKLILKR